MAWTWRRPSHGDPAPGARVLVYADDRPLIVRRTFGSGTVDFLAFDPQAEPVRSWSDKTSL